MDDSEFVERFVSPGGALSFDEPLGLFSPDTGFAAFGGAFAGSFVLDVDDRQPQY